MQSETESEIVPVFTGAGKSSIIAALTRLMEIQDGRILLHGCSVQAMSLACLRQQVAVIPQQPFLFQVGLHLDKDATGPSFWNDNAGSNCIAFLRLPGKPQIRPAHQDRSCTCAEHCHTKSG